MVHFFHRHSRVTVVVVEEGNLPQPRCPRFYMMVMWKALNGLHNTTSQCDKGLDQKRRRLEAEEMVKIKSKALQAYGRPLKMVTPFK